MSQPSKTSNYTQGYSEATVASHESRTVDSDAAFLLSHIKPTDHILDVGCGPGTITLGLARHASQGRTTGIDISDDVLQKARALGATAQDRPTVVFEQGDVLAGLAYADDTFDIVFCSQLFPHLPPPDLPLRALAEMRRVLKPGGILATRDAADLHFYPRAYRLDNLWARNLCRSLGGGAPGADLPGGDMPALFRKAGFGTPDGCGKLVVGAGTTVHAGPEARRRWATHSAGRLAPGDPSRQSWLDAGITEAEIEEVIRAVRRWGEDDDGWYAALQCEILAWK